MVLGAGGETHAKGPEKQEEGFRRGGFHDAQKLGAQGNYKNGGAEASGFVWRGGSVRRSSGHFREKGLEDVAEGIRASGQGLGFGRNGRKVGNPADGGAGGMGGTQAGFGVLKDATVLWDNVEKRGGAEVNVGRGFAVLDLVATDDGAEKRAQAGVVKLALGALGARGGGDGTGPAAAFEPREQFDCARLDGDAAGEEGLVVGVGPGDEAGDGFLEAEALDEAGADVGPAAANHFEKNVGREGEAEVGGARVEGGVGEALGVEEQAIHVEDEGGAVAQGAHG